MLSRNIPEKGITGGYTRFSVFFAIISVFLSQCFLRYLFSEEVAGINLYIEQFLDIHLCSNSFCSSRD
jgi:hypothetical protein